MMMPVHITAKASTMVMIWDALALSPWYKIWIKVRLRLLFGRDLGRTTDVTKVQNVTTCAVREGSHDEVQILTGYVVGRRN